MKNNPVYYIKYPIISEILAQPIFWIKAIKRGFKNERIKDSLEKIIDDSKKITSEKNKLSELELHEYEIQYKELNNFFSKFFFLAKKLDFEFRIKYVLKRYKQEIYKLSSASNSIILEENFLNGARKTLYLYFILAKYNRIASNDILQEKVFNEMEDDFFDEFNRVFSPEMDKNKILDFLYKIYNQPIKVKVDKKTKAYFIIYILSEKIQSTKKREDWINNIVEYLNIEMETYEKKKLYHFWDNSKDKPSKNNKIWGAKMLGYINKSD